MRALVLVVALAMSVPAAARAQATAVSTTDELIRLDREWQEAVVKGDAEFTETRTAGSFRFTHGGGTRSDTKADWLRIARNVPQRFLERRASEQTVELHGDVALVFGRLDVRMAGAANAVPSCYSLEYVHAYALVDGRWMFLSHRTMRGIDAVHPCAATWLSGTIPSARDTWNAISAPVRELPDACSELVLEVQR